MAHTESARSILEHPEDIPLSPRCASPDGAPIISYEELVAALEKLELQEGELSDRDGRHRPEATKGVALSAADSSTSPIMEEDDGGDGESAYDLNSPTTSGYPSKKDSTVENESDSIDELVEFGSCSQR